MEDAKRVTPAYLWFDTEFTGLDTDSAQLLQVALVPTDVNLKRLAPPARDLCLCIRLAPGAPVSPWVAENLGGLLARCRSDEAVAIADADRALAQLVDDVVGPAAREIKNRPILAGNTVHMDVALARRFLPEFSRRLHYRVLDVSTLKVLWGDWSGQPAFDKENAAAIRQYLPEGFSLPAAAAHDACFDIHASLAELNYYRTLGLFRG